VQSQVWRLPPERGVLADRGLVAVGQALDDFVDLAILQLDHLLEGRVRIREDEVVVDRAREQDRFLRTTRGWRATRCASARVSRPLTRMRPSVGM